MPDSERHDLELLTSEELAVYRNVLRIQDTNFWKIYTIPRNNTDGLLKSTRKSKLNVIEAESVYEVIVYSSKDFKLIDSNLYPQVIIGNTVQIEINSDNSPCYVFIWSTGNVNAAVTDESNVDMAVPINNTEMLHQAFNRIDMTMNIFASSVPTGDIFADDYNVIGPLNIGHQFTFDLAVAERAVCVGYGLTPVVSWNTAIDPVLKNFDIKMLDSPGHYVEIGPLACRSYMVSNR
jgi:hypothetical protein